MYPGDIQYTIATMTVLLFVSIDVVATTLLLLSPTFSDKSSSAVDTTAIYPLSRYTVVAFAFSPILPG